MALAQQEDGAIRLEISDDGAGLPAGSNWPGGQTMGGLMVQSFVQGLQAELDVTSAATGTRVVVTIPAP